MPDEIRFQAEATKHFNIQKGDLVLDDTITWVRPIIVLPEGSKEGTYDVVLRRLPDDAAGAGRGEIEP